MSGNLGRPPKPTMLKLLTGNPGKRPLKLDEFRPDVKSPECPAHLATDAKNEWLRIAPLLEKHGLISEEDSAALALYCHAFGRWVEAERKIGEMRAKGGDGLIVKAPSGYPIQNPYIAISNKAMEQCYVYLQMFGLSPSARTRVTPSARSLDLPGFEQLSLETLLA